MFFPFIFVFFFSVMCAGVLSHFLHFRFKCFCLPIFRFHLIFVSRFVSFYFVSCSKLFIAKFTNRFLCLFFFLFFLSSGIGAALSLSSSSSLSSLPHHRHRHRHHKYYTATKQKQDEKSLDIMGQYKPEIFCQICVYASISSFIKFFC